jgi:hypothetical protein
MWTSSPGSEDEDLRLAGQPAKFFGHDHGWSATQEKELTHRREQAAIPVRPDQP